MERFQRHKLKKACDPSGHFTAVLSVLAAVQQLGTFSGSWAPFEPLLSFLRFGIGSLGVGTIKKIVLMISFSVG